MRPWPSVVALALTCILPPALAVGVDQLMGQEAVGGPCVDLTRVYDGDYLRVVAPPPCGPDATVDVRYCDGSVILVVEASWPRPFDHHFVWEGGILEEIIDLEDDDDCP